VRVWFVGVLWWRFFEELVWEGGAPSFAMVLSVEATVVLASDIATSVAAIGPRLGDVGFEYLVVVVSGAC